jgi:hypothetical protein
VVSTSAAVGVTSVRVLYTDENSQTADMTIKVTVRSTALPSWSMTNLGANLVAWWDISNASSVTSSGGFASAVTDLTGNGHDLTQSTGANQPAYSATGRNSLPALTCDGSNDFMVIGAPTTLPAIGQSFTMGGELWGDAALGSFKYILGLGTDTANLTGGIGADSSGYIRPQLTETVVTPNGDNTTSLIKGADGVVIWRLGAANANSRQLSRVSLDGSSTLHKSLGQALATTNQARLCGYPSSSTAATSNWKGGLQEGFIAMPDVTDEQKLIIDGYLAWKWGRQSSLPSDHPFKNAAPLAIH